MITLFAPEIVVVNDGVPLAGVLSQRILTAQSTENRT